MAFSLHRRGSSNGNRKGKGRNNKQFGLKTHFLIGPLKERKHFFTLNSVFI
jgi:hypothetical protein